MLTGLGQPTIQECETSWNPFIGAECILNGTIIQQVASSVLPPAVLPGIFPVSSATDGSDSGQGSWIASIGWIAGLGFLGYLALTRLK